MIGLIGKKLGHSYSKIIHEQLGNHGYQMIEVDEFQLKELFEKKQILACNVTIPYKQTVLNYLDEMDDVTKDIHACNTIVYEHGKYVGHNTDAGGFEAMLRMNGIDVKGKKAIVLGNGGASKAICWVLKKHGISEIILVKKNLSQETITYEKCYQQHTDAQILVNTSPVGMFPASDELVIDLNYFDHLEAVLDVIYNPLSTRLLTEARLRGIKTCGGLLMLVAQAVEAAGYFQSKIFPDAITGQLVESLVQKKQNLVLIGMPGCGKSTIAEALGIALGRRVVDLDAEIVKDIGMSIKNYFDLYGEEEFRNKETELTKRFMNETGCILSCGGGIVTRRENMVALLQNGFVIWLKRDLNLLEVSESRPLSSKKQQLKALYEQRKDLYALYADAQIINEGTIEETVHAIIETWKRGHLS